MVFIHGGGYVYGSGTVPLYDGAQLADATGAIVVTLNYRLGAFGFLSNPALRAEDPAHPSAGNYGIEDQIAALQWVQKNAAGFGGDPANVTAFGESAGATSLLVHLASPRSAGLFAHAIVESAALWVGKTTLTPAVADKGGAKVAEGLGCTSAWPLSSSPSDADLLSCLRGHSTADILQVVADSGTPFTGGITWSPVVDGFVLPDDLVKVFESGTFNKVPTVIGTNKNEARLFFYSATSGINIPAPTGQVTYWGLEALLFPGNGLEIVNEYPASSFQGSYKAAAAEVLTDAMFVCGARSVARALAAAGVPTFRYDFTHVLDMGVPDMGAFHASELAYVFANPEDPQFPLTPTDLSVSKQVMAYWGSMATHGDPNVAGQSAWPRYDTTNETQIVLDQTVSTESAYKKDECDFWDGVGN
jgi:para-nitrobenzyl esterase